MINFEYGAGAVVNVRTVLSLYSRGDVGKSAVREAITWDRENGAGVAADLEWGVRCGLITAEEREEFSRGN